MSIAVRESSLDELAATANNEHRQVESKLEDALLHVINSGEALNRAFELVPYGQWESWCAANLILGQSSAQIYRRIAHAKDAIRESGVPTIAAARRFLIAQNLAIQDTSKARNETIKRLHRSGLSERQVAQLCGVSQTTVNRVTSATARAQQEAAWSRSRAKRKAALKALRNEERLRQTKATGGSIAKAYALTRQLAEVLEAGRFEYEGEAKRFLTSALQSLYNVEDLVVKASKAS